MGWMLWCIVTVMSTVGEWECMSENWALLLNIEGMAEVCVCGLLRPHWDTEGKKGLRT